MIKLNNVEKIYNKGSQANLCLALSNINLEFPDKGLFFISGRSGCGKTTLLNILSSLDKPTAGEVINNYDTVNFYSIIFQDYQLIDYLTVRENILLASLTDEIMDVCNECQISDILDHYPNQISGGQKQRVAIARAILMDKPVIFCDEPTGNLDEENSKIIASLLKKESISKLVIVVSHDKEIFEDICDDIIEINNGVISKKEQDNFSIKEEINVKEKVFGFKEKSFLVFKILRKNIIKNLFLILSLFLSFLLIVSSLNIILNKESVIRYNYYKNIDASQVDFKLKSKKYADESRSLSSSEQDYYLNKYDSFMYYDYDLSLNYNDIRINASRVYVTDICPMKMLYGSEYISDDEIIISDYIASKLTSNIQDLIGEKLDSNMVIAGIFETGFLKEDRSDKPDFLEKLYSSIYMTSDRFYKYNNQEYYSYVVANDKLYSSYVIFNQNRNIVAGTYKELEEGEIAIGKGIALSYSDDITSLIDTKITIDFSNRLDPWDSSSLGDIKSYTFTVKYIFNTTSMSNGKEDLVYNVQMNPKDMSSCYRDIANKFYHDNGLSITRYNKNAFDTLEKNGFFDDTFIAYEIDDSVDWLKTLSFVMLAVGGILTVIAMIIVINYAHTILDKDKRIMGVLASIGLRRKTIMLLYYFGVVILSLVAFALSLIGQVFSIMLINSIIKNMDLTTRNIVYYGAYAPLLMIAMLSIILGIIYLVFYKRFKHKEIIDIIYER